MTNHKVQIAIVDYGLGNLFSVKQACEYAGMDAIITSARKELFAAKAVILPGVGAFGDAMSALKKLDLVAPLKDIAQSEQYLIGIRLGMQLLLTESYEFGTHKGLGVIEGVVRPLKDPVESKSFDGTSRKLKVPQIGWNRIWPREQNSSSWVKTPLEGISAGEYMYFVHSYYVELANTKSILAMSQYGQIKFCSSLQYNNTFACQFHPERSGPKGLHLYSQLRNYLQKEEQIL